MTGRYQTRDFGNGIQFLGVWIHSEYKVCRADNDSWCRIAVLAAKGDLRAVHYGPETYGHIDYFFVPGRGRIVSKSGIALPA